MQRTSFGLLLVAFALSTSAGAQPRDTGRVSTKPLFTGHDALVGGAFVVATVGLTQLDKRIAEHVADLRTSSNSDFYQSRADEIKLVNERSLFAVSAGSYVVGRLGHLERLADFGLHASEAIVVAAGVATVFKSGLGRSRPALSQRTTAAPLSSTPMTKLSCACGVKACV